jgi:hypothetical protein
MKPDPAMLCAIRDSLQRSHLTKYLTDFVETLVRLDEADGFTACDIAAVESAWGSFGEELWYGGFVVSLKDGRRAYLDAYAGERHWSGDDVDVTVQFLRPGEAYPKLGSDHYQTLFGWDDRASEELDEFLIRLAAV